MAETRMLVNLERCIGCWSCAMACKIGNGLDDDKWWMTVRTLGSGEGIDRPAGVYPKLTMGWMPVWSKKCISCPERISEDREPYCVHSCPTKALLHRAREADSAIADERERLLGKGYRVFELPTWEDVKPGTEYASRR